MIMNILLYRYGSICEPDMISAFKQTGLNVIEETTEITNKNITQQERIALIKNHFDKENILFVFSINFFPAIAEICHIYKVNYLCWTVDSPVPELFSQSIKYDTNHVFLFDKAQFNSVKAFNPDGIHHLPLASAIERFDNVISTISSVDKSKFGSDISFVGSLYTEKDPLKNILNSTDQFSSGYIEGLCRAASNIYGYYIPPSILTTEMIAIIKSNSGDDFYSLPNPVINTEDFDKYIATHSLFGYHIAAIERTDTLNALAKHFKVDLYTNSNVDQLNNVNSHPGISTLNEMPKVFHLSKINLNMTMRSIETGLPLRCFDILGCGGFLLTNYQEELEDMFEIGVDIETYSNHEELIDKCSYYLSHEDERANIAQNGYNKVKNNYRYIHRIKDMLKVII